MKGIDNPISEPAGERILVSMRGLHGHEIIYAVLFPDLALEASEGKVPIFGGFEPSSQDRHVVWTWFVELA